MNSKLLTLCPGESCGIFEGMLQRKGRNKCPMRTKCLRYKGSSDVSVYVYFLEPPYDKDKRICKHFEAVK